MSRDLLLVALALFAWGMGEGTYFLFQPLYLGELGASPVSIGTILGAVGIAMTLAHIPAGYLADRMGRRILMWSAWILGVTAGATMALARSLPVFAAGAILYGVTAFVSAPMNSYITAARGKWSVGRAITFTQVFYNTGAIFGPVIGGMVGDRFGYAAIYAFATSIFIASSIIIFFIRSQPIEKTEGSYSSRKTFNRYFIGFLPILFLAYLGMYLSQPLAPNYLQQNHQLLLKDIGWLGSINNIGNVTFNLVLGTFSAHIGFLFGQLSAIFFPILLWRGTGMPWFATAFFMLGGFRAAGVMALAHLRKFVSAQNMGLAYGIAQTTVGLATILAPILAGLLYEKKPVLVFQIAIVIILISMTITLIFTKWSSRRQRFEISSNL